MQDELTPIREPYQAYSSKELVRMKREAFETAREQIPQAKIAQPQEVAGIVGTSLTMMADFETAARSHRLQASRDTDIVWVTPGPGMYDTALDPEIPDRYIHLPWSRNLNWGRILTGTALLRQITADRLNTQPSQLTKEDIIEHGPNLLYTSTPLETEHLEHVLARPTTKIPREKILIYTDVALPDGTSRPIVNTADQVEGLRFPSDNPAPREIALVTNGPHMARVLYMLGKFSHIIPENTVVRAHPVPTAPNGRLIYPVMEVRGILSGIYRDHTASPIPHPYKL